MIFRFLTLFEEFFPGTETLYAIASELGQAVLGLLVALLLFQVALGVEFVSIADELLLECLGQEVLGRQRQVLGQYLLAGQAGTGMALAHAGMAGQPLGTQHVGPYTAMADVGLAAHTADGWGMAAHDAYVVEHGCLDDELAVEAHLRMVITNTHSTPHDERAVRGKYMTELVVLRIVSVYNLINHRHRDAEYKLSHRPC